MKKIIVFLFIAISLLLFLHHDEEGKLNKNVIRFRIVANSNELKDQALKLNIRDQLLDNLKDIEDYSSDIVSAREAINNNLPKIEEKLKSNHINYNINFGINAFPEKEYLGKHYSSGNYESLVITLGDAKGDNWWCILFPPLCLIEAQKENMSEVQYDFYVKKVLSNY